MKKTLFILLCIIVSLSTCIILNHSLMYGFFVAILIVLLLSKTKKASINYAFKELNKCRSVFIIIILLGVNIALWMSSGILPSMVYYSSFFISNLNFLGTTFIITVLVSTVMGTGLGTFSTIGVVFISLSQPLGYPAPLVIGCIVSGAFVADKLSPVAALCNLTLKMTNTSYKTYFKTQLKTLVPTIIMTYIIYHLLNGQYSQEMMSLEHLQHELPQYFNVSIFTLSIPLFMMVLAVIGLPIVYNMLLVAVSSSFLTLFYQEFNFTFYLNTLWKGFKILSSQPSPILDIFKGGGISPMIEVLIIVAGAVSLSGLLMYEHLLDPIIELLMRKTRTVRQLIIKTGLLSSFLTTLTCDQTVGITVPSEVLKTYYDDFELDSSVLARTISDTGTIIAPLQFWNVNALIITGLTGVSAVQYAPYACLCYLCPLVTILLGPYLTLHKEKNGLNL